MSIANEITRINNNIAAAYTKCNNKGATMPQVQNSANLADTIDSIPTGVSEIASKDVNFYDCDGTLLYSYTKAEALELTSLPALPERNGLVCQGWNWTLSDVQAQALGSGVCNIGALYDTEDHSTRLYFSVPKGTKIHNLQIWLNIAAGSQVTVDWGDTTQGVIDNSSGFEPAVLYAEKTGYGEAAENTVLCVRLSGGSFSIGKGGSYTVFGISYNSATQMGDTPVLIRAELGTNCKGVKRCAFYNCTALSELVLSSSVTDYEVSAFGNCFALSAVVLPDGVTNIPTTMFQNCNSLRKAIIPHSVTAISDSVFSINRALSSLVIPDGVASIAQSAMNGCRALASVVIPDGVTVINASTFFSCYSLCSAVIPDSVTTIKASAFSECVRLNSVDLTAYTDPSDIPVLEDANAFGSTPSYLKFKVASQAMKTAFSAATNWSVYAAQFTVG